MDHIDLPTDRAPFEISVPYLVTAEVEYDGLGLSGFPRRRGLITETGQDELTLSQLQQKPADYALAFVQAWLYFGLLQEVFGSSMTREDFIKRNSGLARICTSKLEDLIAKKQVEIGKMKASDESQGIDSEYKARLDERRRISKAITDVLSHATRLDVSWYHPAWCETHMSIRLLASSLQELTHGTQRELRSHKAIPDQVPPLPMEGAPSFSLIREHMIQNGWCVHQFRQLREDVSYSTLVYLANLNRHPRPWIDHGKCHRRESCVAYNIDNSSFQTVHSDFDCSCQHIQAPVAKMHKILRDGGIPVVKCIFGGGNEPLLDYVPAVPGARYAAISHVWSDGLGNPSAHSIPSCQLKRLASRVFEADALMAKHSYMPKVLPHSDHRSQIVYFWLDVYCVPLEPSETLDSEGPLQENDLAPEDLKAVALSKMAVSYSWARYVLVLDDELSTISAQQHRAELVARIGVSAWNSRCWTFQEYCLGRTTVFQGRDGPKSSHFIKSRLSGTKGPPTASHMRRQFWKDMETLVNQPNLAGIIMGLRQRFSPLSFLRRLFRNGQYAMMQNFLHDRTSAFLSISECLNKRTTTKVEDVVGILANLLGLSGGEIMGLCEKDRVKAVLATFSTLPLDLLFADIPRHSRVSQSERESSLPKERWIPIKLHEQILAESSTFVHVTPEGLLLSGSSLTVPHSSERNLRAFKFLCRTGKSWLVRLTDEEQDKGTPENRLKAGGSALEMEETTEEEGKVDSSIRESSTQAEETILQIIPNQCEAEENVFNPLDETLALLYFPVEKTSPKRSTGHGALFTETTSTSHLVQVEFLCSVKWKIIETHSIQQTADVECAQCTHYADGQEKHILVISAIAQWPNLFVRRDKLYNQKAGIGEKCFWLTLFMLWMAAIFDFLGGFYLIGAGGGDMGPGKIFAFIVVFVFPTLVGTLVYQVSGRLLDYYSLLAHIDATGADQNFHRRLEKALPALNAEMLPLTEKIILCFIYTYLGIAKIFISACRLWKQSWSASLLYAPADSFIVR